MDGCVCSMLMPQTRLHLHKVCLCILCVLCVCVCGHMPANTCLCVSHVIQHAHTCDSLSSERLLYETALLSAPKIFLFSRSQLQLQVWGEGQGTRRARRAEKVVVQVSWSWNRCGLNPGLRRAPSPLKIFMKQLSFMWLTGRNREWLWWTFLIMVFLRYFM